MKNKLNYIYNSYSKILSSQEKLNEIANSIKNEQQIIADAINGTQFKTFICEKLEEAIDEFGQNDSKENKQMLESVMTSSTSDGESITSKYEYINPNGKFKPFTDKWEFHSITQNSKGEYKIEVENIKGRKSMGFDCWMPDIYYTDWIKL